MAGIRPSRAAVEGIPPASRGDGGADSSRQGRRRSMGGGTASRGPHGRSRPMGRLASAVVGVLSFVLVAVGTAMLLAPSAIGAVASERSYAEALAFSRQATELEGGEDAEEALGQADDMNRAIAEQGRQDVATSPMPREYWSWPGASDRGVIAVVSSPDIGLGLPVYRDVGDDALSRGAGHLPGTSLPVGGVSTRCVLVGHTAYKDVTLFDEISNLRPGDLVFVTSIAGTLAYRVTGSAVIDPDDYPALSVRQGLDMLTLLTCTPPGVNSHRLAVDCERVEVAVAGRAGAQGAAGQGQQNQAIREVALSSSTGCDALPARWVVALCLLASVCCGALACTIAVYIPARARRRRACAMEPCGVEAPAQAPWEGEG